VVKEKTKGKKENDCYYCGAPLRDEDVFQHGGNKFCAKCIAEHIKEEHFNDPAVRRAWTFKSA
jgi:hypothetical protein